MTHLRNEFATSVIILFSDFKEIFFKDDKPKLSLHFQSEGSWGLEVGSWRFRHGGQVSVVSCDVTAMMYEEAVDAQKGLTKNTLELGRSRVFVFYLEVGGKEVVGCHPLTP